MRLLVLANIVPFPGHGGIQLRILELLRRIARRHEVTLGCHSWSEQDDANAELQTREGIRTVTGRVYPRPAIRHALGAVRYALTRRPPELALYRSPELWRRLRQMLRTQPFDVFQIEETLLAPYLALLPRAYRTKRVLTFHNIHFVQARRAANLESGRSLRAWRRANSLWMSRYEPRIAASFDRCITVSDHDRQLLLEQRPGLSIDVVPNGVDTRLLRGLPPAGGKPSLLFVGSMGYKPCEDAALWLVGEILPLLCRRHPDLEVWLVGREPTARVRSLAGDGVCVTGEVADVVPYYARSHVVVVPLRGGSGSRLKILEAMALGRPVVSTTIGAEGLDVADGEHLLLADTANAFAAAVERTIADAVLRGSLTAAARGLVEERYDWESVAAKQLRIYEELVAS